MDRLQQLWDAQAKQQEDLGIAPQLLARHEQQDLAGKMILGINEEVVKLQQLVSRYKRHILAQPSPVPENVSDKVADILKYIVCIAQLHGVEPDDIMSSFQRKTAVVYDKARGERLRQRLSRRDKVVCIDMDDVICDLSPWRAALEGFRGDAPMNERTLRLVESYKEEFYQNGRFSELKPVAGAREGMRTLRDEGFKIIIITARPQWQYPRLYADTIQWLVRHGIPYDLLVFDKDKAEAIYQYITPAWPMFFVEDHARNALGLEAIGVDVMLFDCPHNQGVSETPKIKRVVGWDGVLAAYRSRMEVTDAEQSDADIAASMRCE